MKLTFKLVTANTTGSFDLVVNEYLGRGYRILQGSTVLITKRETPEGYSYQYALPMVLEEEV